MDAVGRQRRVTHRILFADKECNMAVLQPTDVPVEEYLETVPDRRVPESHTLIEIMREISGDEPVMWGPSIIGFGHYHYKYASGHEGDAGKLGFSPRKASISIYFADGLADYKEELSRLGKHRAAVGCLYVNKLADIDLDVLREMLERSYERAGDFDAMHGKISDE